MKKKKKFSNQKLVKMVQTQYEKLKTPSRSDLMYSCMVNLEWNRTLSSEAVSMWLLANRDLLTEKTESKKSERDEIAECLGGERDEFAINVVMSMPQEDKEWLKRWHKYGGNGEPPNVEIKN